MSNPFEIIEARLSNIETLLLDIKHQPKQAEPTEPKPRWTPRKEAAEHYKVSLPTLDKYTAQGIIQGYKIGGKIMFKSDDLDRAFQAIKNAKYRRS